MTPVPCQSCVLTVQQPDGVENKTNRRQLRGKHCGGWGEAKLIRFGSATSSLAYMHANALLFEAAIPTRVCACLCVCVKPRERTSVGCEHFQPSFLARLDPALDRDATAAEGRHPCWARAQKVRHA